MLKHFEKAAHLTTGFILLFHILDRMDAGYRFPVFFSVCCLLCFICVYFNKPLQKSAKLNSVILFIESILVLFIAFNYFERGREIIPVVFIVLAAMFFITGYRNISLLSSKGKRK